jgi:hypothetical protein
LAMIWRGLSWNATKCQALAACARRLRGIAARMPFCLHPARRRAGSPGRAATRRGSAHRSLDAGRQLGQRLTIFDSHYCPSF